MTLRHFLHAETRLEAVARRVWCLSAAVLHRILCHLSRAVGYETCVWDQLISTSRQPPTDNVSLNSACTLLCLFNYSPSCGVAVAHVDIGLLTLRIASGNGLQLLDRSTDPYT